MTLKQFIEDHKRYVDATKTKETADGYIIHLKSQYFFYHWTPTTSYSKQSISIKKSEWQNGVAGTTILRGFYDLSPSDKIKTLTGICKENTNGELMTISPSAFAGFELDYLNWAWVQDNMDAYYRKAGRKTDDSPKQKAAGIGATKSKKILSVSEFDKFAKSKGFKAKFADTEKFVSFMFKHSKDLFGRSSLKGMSWTAIYNLNPNSVDWIGWSKIDTDDFLEYVKQYSRKRK
jgi:hypothetical protein